MERECQAGCRPGLSTLLVRAGGSGDRFTVRRPDRGGSFLRSLRPPRSYAETGSRGDVQAQSCSWVGWTHRFAVLAGLAAGPQKRPPRRPREYRHRGRSDSPQDDLSRSVLTMIDALARSVLTMIDALARSSRPHSRDPIRARSLDPRAAARVVFFAVPRTVRPRTENRSRDPTITPD